MHRSTAIRRCVYSHLAKRSGILKNEGCLNRLSCRRAPFSTDSSLRVAFVGLGNMGLPMALNLAKVQHHKDERFAQNTSVIAYDSNNDAAVAATRQSSGKIRMMDSIEEIAKSAQSNKLDAIFTMLPNDEIVDAVMNELLGTLAKRDDMYDATTGKRSLSIVDCSTISPATSKRWNDIWATQGHTMLDAPVSGGVTGAAAGTLTFMVGGRAHVEGTDSFNSVVRPLLQLMGTNVLLCGGPGTGSATKLCNNLALAAQMVGICEAMNLGDSLGVDPVVLASVMNVSTAACWSSQVNSPHPVVATAMSTNAGQPGSPAANNYQGGFGVKLMLKDLTLAASTAEACGVAMPLTSTTRSLYLAAANNGLADKDFGVMLQYLKRL